VALPMERAAYRACNGQIAEWALALVLAWLFASARAQSPDPTKRAADAGRERRRCASAETARVTKRSESAFFRSVFDMTPP